MLAAVERLPRPNAVRTIRLRQNFQWLESPIVWRAVRNGNLQNLQSLAQGAARLLSLGIVVVDEEDTVLTNIVEVMQEVTTSVNEDLDLPE